MKTIALTSALIQLLIHVGDPIIMRNANKETDHRALVGWGGGGGAYSQLLPYGHIAIMDT